MNFANCINSNTTFFDIQTREQIIKFLDTKIKTIEEDPDAGWITTWNHYLSHIKYFFRWLYNEYNKKNSSISITDVNNSYYYCPSSYWQTPSFIQIGKKKTKRTSPYLETELWERDELLCILIYEPSKRNKAALALFWDLDVRNHEITLLKIKHIRLKERYGEGEIPHEAKTGTGGPIKPEAMWTMMKYLRSRIIRLVEEKSITSKEEKEKLEYLIKNKKMESILHKTFCHHF